MWFPWSRRFDGASAPARAREQAAAARIRELTASRRAVADAYEVERQRIEADLHDGAQQYFVAAAMKIGEARLDALEVTNSQLSDTLAEAHELLSEGLRVLRHTVHGIHPQVLTDRGLFAAVEDIAASYGPHVVVRCPHSLPELSPSVLASGYFFASEALTNAAKHAPGAPVSVLLTCDATLNISVVDQGPGGAYFGSGLENMRQRLAAFDGQLDLRSPAGGPTTVTARIPMLLDRGQPGISSEGSH
ncbi:sensor histidine kinase [Corynebacterium uterequi]|uniref:histidine kinase n=1 Tax=Corynebacterium uterequi TaxID=1072256 RepID=A0A0G3HAH2_9CORY|nr:histidine kinase [Corynebacterium uterequi]AKK10371.1 histidine kinase [Corynebacterium uterequi]